VRTLGESLLAHRLKKLNRYETDLDRRFERASVMSTKPKALRGGW